MRGITYLLGAVVALTVVVVYKAHPTGHADGVACPRSSESQFPPDTATGG